MLQYALFGWFFLILYILIILFLQGTVDRKSSSWPRLWMVFLWWDTRFLRLLLFTFFNQKIFITVLLKLCLTFTFQYSLLLFDVFGTGMLWLHSIWYGDQFYWRNWWYWLLLMKRFLTFLRFYYDWLLRTWFNMGRFRQRRPWIFMLRANLFLGFALLSFGVF